MSFDASLLEWMAAHRVAPLTWLGELLGSLAGKRRLAVIGLIGTVILLALRKFRVLITAGVAVAVAEGLGLLLKMWFARPRPPADLAVIPAHGYSMPSTDSAFAAALLLAVALTWPFARRRSRTWAIWAAVVIACFIGAMTVYVGAHWPTDVLVGLPLGFAVALGTAWVGGRIRPETAWPSSERAAESIPPAGAPIPPEDHRDH